MTFAKKQLNSQKINEVLSYALTDKNSITRKTVQTKNHENKSSKLKKKNKK